MKLNKEQEDMLTGKEGLGVQKAMEIIVGMGEAQGAKELVKISYAHLMPPDVMFMPFGKQGRWAHDLTGELTWYSGAQGCEVSKPMAQCVVHFFNHQTHHRGQVHAMLTAAGCKGIGDTDLAFMPEDVR